MNSLLRSSLALLVLGVFCSTAGAVEKPQTMEEMWKIIQAQQKQIDAMSKSLEKVATKPESGDITELERKTEVLTEEVEKMRTEMVIPEEPEYKSEYGLGPAASKVYKVDKGLSIGAYGEANYQAIVGDKECTDGKGCNNADFERLVMYLGYKFTDSIIFNSEIEFEHSSTDKKGSVSVEFAALDFLIDPMANIRAGMVLLPMGFLNPIHEPPFYFGNNRPEVEKRIIPSTWREIGGGLLGQILPDLTYTAYVVNGLDAEGFSSKGIRGGRQKGSKALAENLAFVGRLDYAPSSVPGLSVGTSMYLGNSGQDKVYAGVKADAFTQLYEAHAQWKYKGWELRALGSIGFIDDAGILSAAKGQTIGKSNYGWYVEAGYDVLPLFLPDTTQYLAPFFRYEMYDTIASAPAGFKDDPFQDQKIFQFGLQYKPIPTVVIKADYRNFTSPGGTLPDDFNIGVGFIY